MIRFREKKDKAPKQNAPSEGLVQPAKAEPTAPSPPDTEPKPKSA